MSAWPWATAAALVVALVPGAGAQPHPLQGYWAEAECRSQHSCTVVHFAEAEDGFLAGTLIVLQPSVDALRTEMGAVLLLEADTVFFHIPDLGIAFTGTLAADPGLLSGVTTFPDGSTERGSRRRVSQHEFRGLLAHFVTPRDTSAYVYRTPSGRGDGWTTASLPEAGIDTDAIVRIVDDIRQGGYGLVDSFLIAKGGRLVLEEYFRRWSAEDLHSLSSQTKSVTALVVGKARELGYIGDLEDEAVAYLGDYARYLPAGTTSPTVEDLLTMRTGFEPVNPAVHPLDFIPFALNREVVRAPGTRFEYDNVAPNIFSVIIRNATGLHLDRFAKTHLFAPLGIRDFDWDEGKFQGYPVCVGTLKLRPRDMAKLGQLVLSDGVWQGRRILDATFTARMKTVQAVVDPENGVYYGYLWWIGDFPHATLATRMIYAGGSGGQYTFVIPERDAVVLFTGSNHGNGRELELFDLVGERLLPALGEPVRSLPHP